MVRQHWIRGVSSGGVVLQESVGDAISQSGSAGVAAPVKTVWVGNLGGHIAEQHLCDVFRPFGTITRCEVQAGCSKPT